MKINHDNLRILRETYEYTQTEMAELFEMTRQHYARIESGQVEKFAAIYLLKMTDKFGMDYDEIMAILYNDYKQDKVIFSLDDDDFIE